MIIHLFLGVFLFGISSAESFKNNCFKTKIDHAVSNSKPIAELFRVSASECLNYCISNSPRVGDGCSSVTYHREFSTCQLYGHDGTFEGSAVVSAFGHDFFLRNSYVGICQDPIVPRRGYKQTPKMYGVPARKSVTEPIPMEFMENLQEVTETVPVESTTGYSDPRIHVELPPEFEEQLEEQVEKAEDGVKTISFLNPTRNTVCTKPDKIGYFVLFGYKMVNVKKHAKLVGVDQSSCVMYCSQNIDNKGNKKPCTSVNYDPVNEICTLYGEGEQKSAKSTLAENKDYIFADKFCLKSKKNCAAESPFIVYPFKQVHKKIIQAFPGMNSVVACVATCVDNKKCKAVTYKRGLCILHDASITTDFSYLVDGNEQTMVIENGCELTANAVPSLISNQFETPEKAEKIDREEVPWDEWSPCQFGVGGKRVRVRQRECENCEDLQIEEC